MIGNPLDVHIMQNNFILRIDIRRIFTYSVELIITVKIQTMLVFTTSQITNLEKLKLMERSPKDDLRIARCF